MAEYLEDFDNELGQVFAEFSSFLYVTKHDCKNNKMLHNIMLDSKRVYIRTLCDFFSNTKPNSDDLIYKDFLKENLDLSVKIDKNLRIFINKSTAHLSKKRGKFLLQDDDILPISKELIKAIKRFVREAKNGNLLDEYKKQLLDQDVQYLLRTIEWQLVEVISAFAQAGEVIQL